MQADRADLSEGAVRFPFVLAALFLAAVPPALVFVDRWLDRRPALESWFGFFRNLWCRAELLCSSAYPPYFGLAAISFLLLICLIFIVKGRPVLSTPITPPAQARAPAAPPWQRYAGTSLLVLAGLGLALLAGVAFVRRAVPGWELAAVIAAWLAGWILREASLLHAARLWWSNRGAWLAAAAAILSLLAVLAGLYGRPQFPWAYALLLAASLLGLLRWRRSLDPGFWLALAALALLGSNLNAWWLSAIGDEYSFWGYAREIAGRQTLSEIGERLFNGQAVYGAHPYLSSLIQAAFMRLFGIDGFGWRISNACLSAAAVGLVYVFLRGFVSRGVAVAAAALLAVSHYLISFSKIGYNNLQALFAEALVLAAAGWAVRSRRPLAFACTGLSAALCFYVYPAALYVLPLPAFLLVLYDPPRSWASLRRWLLASVSLLMAVFPLLLQPGYWQAKVAGTFLYKPDLVASAGTTLSHVARNWVYAFFSFLFLPHEDHFVAVSYVDPITGLFACIGLGLCLRAALRDRFAGFSLLSFGMLLLLAGASHDREFPSATRMFLLLPWHALYAAAGLAWVWAGLQRAGLLRGQTWLRAAACAAAIVLVAVNLVQAYPLARDRMVGYQSLETLFLRAVQQAQRDEIRAPKTYVFISDPSWTSIGIQMFAEVYPIRARFVDVVVREPVLPESARQTVASEHALVIIKPWLEASWQQALEAPLRSLGKVPCPVRATDGNVRFILWHSPGLTWLCDRAGA